MEDRISTLPDDVRISILSRLTMREAARTSVLSSKWRYLWVPAFTSRIIFDGRTMIGENYKLIEVHKRTKKFAEFVHQVMQLIRHTGSKPDSFRVCFALDNKYADYIDMWIDFVISAGVKELHLNLFPFSNIFNRRDVKADFDTGERYVFPFALFSDGKGSSMERLHVEGCLCKFPLGFQGLNGLRSISLKNVIWEDRGLGNLLAGCALLESLSISSASRLCGNLEPRVKYLNVNSLAALRSLFLKDITIGNEDLGEILSGCRLLQSLSLIGLKIPDKISLEHSSVHLKYLEIDSSSDTPIQVLISADNLQTFKFFGSLASISFGNVPKLVNLWWTHCTYVSLPYFSYLPNQVCSQLENLFVDAQLINLRPSFTPKLSNLKQLRVRMAVRNGDLIRLAYFLEACPVLHDLHVEISQPEWVKQKLDEGNMRRLPKCVHHHMKMVNFTGFKGNNKEVELALHIVCNAVALESMIIDPKSRFQMQDGRVMTVVGIPSQWAATRQIIYELLSKEACSSLKLLVL